MFLRRTESNIFSKWLLSSRKLLRASKKSRILPPTLIRLYRLNTFQNCVGCLLRSPSTTPRYCFTLCESRRLGLGYQCALPRCDLAITCRPRWKWGRLKLLSSRGLWEGRSESQQGWQGYLSPRWRHGFTYHTETWTTLQRAY